MRSVVLVLLSFLTWSACAQTRLVASHVTGLHQVGSDWSLIYAPGSLFAINRNGGNGRTDFHELTEQSGFRTIRHYSTALHKTDANWEFFSYASGIGAIARKGSSGKTELHYLEAKSGFTTFGFQTPLPATMDAPEWRFGSGRSTEIVCVQTAGGQGTEAHIAYGNVMQDRREDFKVWKWQTATAISFPTNKNWDIRIISDGDIAAFNRNGANGQVDLHTMGREDFYKSFKAHIPLGFSVKDSDRLEIAQVGPLYRVYHIRTVNTKSGSTEVDVYETKWAKPPDPANSYCQCSNSVGNLLERSQTPGCTYFACSNYCAKAKIDRTNGVSPSCRPK